MKGSFYTGLNELSGRGMLSEGKLEVGTPGSLR